MQFTVALLFTISSTTGADYILSDRTADSPQCDLGISRHDLSHHFKDARFVITFIIIIIDFMLRVSIM
jgi:hypothetical protein